jgi:hypothetical protein
MMKLVALFAIAALYCVKAASFTAEAPLAIFYSFDSPASPALMAEMQSELDRILAPANLRVTWRSTDTQSNGAEDFPDIVVFRFHGRCSFDTNSAEEELLQDPGGTALASTQITDGHVLPFGEVDCDKLRHFIAPTARSLDASARNCTLGRAMARVSAHEIYHMLTGSELHASKGIARPAHSRAELTIPSFTFAKPETEWLRSWAERETKMMPESESSESESSGGR